MVAIRHGRSHIRAERRCGRGAAGEERPSDRLPGACSGLSFHDEAFRQGLHDLGYAEGKNLGIENRAANDKEDRLPGLAADLVRLKVDVIVALHPRSACAAMNATKTIPIVFRSSGDPVAQGFVASLARPGGNMTGMTSISTELNGKRLELLKEVLPKASRVAVLRKAGTDALSLEECRLWLGSWGSSFNPWSSEIPVISRTHSKPQPVKAHRVSLR